MIDTPSEIPTSISPMDRIYDPTPAPEPVIPTDQTTPPTHTEADQAEPTPTTDDAPAAESTSDAPDLKEETTDSDYDFLNDSAPVSVDDSKLNAVAAIDYTPYTEVFGREITSQAEILSEIQTLRTAQTQLNEVFKGVDKELIDLVELARSGGDWREVQNYATFDYTQIPPAEFFKDHLINTGQFADSPEGRQAMNDWVETIDPIMLNSLGQQHKNNTIAQQQQFLQEKKNTAIAEKQRKDVALRTELDSIDSFAGIKVTPTQKERLRNMLSNGDGILRDAAGQPNYKESIQAALLWQHRKDIFATMQSKKKAEGTKQALTSASNVSVVKNTVPLPLTETQPQSAMDRFYGNR